jgi:hypothetical protein
LRELGLGLAEIVEVLDRQVDAVDALRSHYKRLLIDRDRLDTLVRTVARTIDELKSHEGVLDMPKINRPENLFEGFDPTQYDTEARARWPEQWEQSKRFTDTLTPEDTERMQRETTAAMIRMAEFMAAGASVVDPAVQAEVDASYQGLCRFWTPDAAAFACLGQIYVDDPRFKANYDKIAIGLAEYYRDAMAAYADQRLS